jgi:hypothetical protein
MVGDSQEKYLKNKTLAQVEKKKGDSHFWSGLMDVLRIVFSKEAASQSKMVLKLDSGKIFAWAMSL